LNEIAPEPTGHGLPLGTSISGENFLQRGPAEPARFHMPLPLPLAGARWPADGN